jgi:hypothetical protein
MEFGHTLGILRKLSIQRINEVVWIFGSPIAFVKNIEF